MKVQNERIRRLLYGTGAAVVAAGMVATVELAANEVAAEPLVLDHARVEVSVSERQLYLYREGELVRTYTVGVGKPDWPTKRGEWHIYQIDWNPDFTPPDQDWASDMDEIPPGHEDNPMGRVRLRYDPPRGIHGTEDLESLGEAESHGSIRISNPDGIELATLLMEASGDGRPEDWYDRVLANETEMVTVQLSTPIPIVVRD
jgi:lipoprotein-anchoring transpeptidase ErfK/SrfK